MALMEITPLNTKCQNIKNKPTPKKMKTPALILALLLVVLFSCNNSEKKENQSGNDTTKVEKKESNGKRYGVEQGSVIYQMETMGIPTTIEMYWKDFGDISANVSTMEMMGVKTITTNVIKDGYSYTYNNQDNNGQKVKLNPKSTEQLNYNDLDEEVMKEFNMKKLNNEKVMDKDCEVYSMDYMGVKTKTWIWQGIAIKMESEAMGIPVKMTVKEIKDGIAPPAEVFELPKKINFKEVSAMTPGKK